MLERARALGTIRIFGEELHQALLPERLAKLEVSEQEVVALAFVRACLVVGVSEVEVREAIEADFSLSEVEEATIRQATLGTPDPGPYDVISRESPCGTPANLHLNTYGAAAVHEPVTLPGTRRY
jgi:hypothetical protein